MSSEQEENANHLDELNANYNTTETNQSSDKKDNGLNEHAKPRRRRRGKKRKHKKESAATCEAENHGECESELHAESDHADCDSLTWNSDENLSCDVNTFTDVMIRPINVPKAPENSTQFIMDDHNDCRFYMSFETPNPYLADPPHPDGDDGDIIEPDGEDAAYRDIDYQYVSPQDFDNSAYYDREFELSYKNNRFDELMRLPRAELISALQGSESRLKELSDDLVKENPSPILEKLQAELLELQEKHSYLKECNSKLATMLLQNESDCSVHDITPESLPENLSLSLEDQDSQEESDREEVHKVCDEPAADVSMSDIHVGSEICDKSCNILNLSNTFCDELLFQNESDCSVHGITPESLPLNLSLSLNDHDSQEESNKEEAHKVCDEPVADVSMSDIDVGSEMRVKSCNSSYIVSNTICDQLPPEQTKSKEILCMTTFSSSEGNEAIQMNNSNLRVMHCQPNSIVKDDIRTLSINNDLFNIAKQSKCSSAVSREGGMSPSETSVN